MTPEQKIASGGVVQFVYHEFSNREPVDIFMAKHKAVGQQDLGLWIEPTIHVWLPKPREI